MRPLNVLLWDLQRTGSLPETHGLGFCVEGNFVSLLLRVVSELESVSLVSSRHTSLLVRTKLFLFKLNSYLCSSVKRELRFRTIRVLLFETPILRTRSICSERLLISASFSSSSVSFLTMISSKACTRASNVASLAFSSSYLFFDRSIRGI